MPITKLAETMLRPHQKRVLDKLQDEDVPGVLAYHSLGSGKTLTALKAISNELNKENIGDKRALFIAPASLTSNVDKEILKHQIDIPADRLDVMSYEKAVRRQAELLRNKYAIIVADEAHKLRNNNTKRASNLKHILSEADKRLLLTGTAAYHKLRDIAPLLNIAANNKVLPEDEAEFDDKFVTVKDEVPSWWDATFNNAYVKERMILKNKPYLKSTLSKYVDRYDAMEDAADDFPRIEERVRHIPMLPEQEEVYHFLTHNMPPELARKVENNLPLNKKELKELNSYSTGMRQVSNTARPYLSDPGNKFYAPKLRTAVNDLKRDMSEYGPGYKALVYSNYLKAGIEPYSQMLKAEGIDPYIYTGKLTKSEKDDLVRKFNAPGITDPRVLLLSSSGGEGLDLMGVNKVQILEPHFNKSKIDQVIGRARRYKSHADLPKDKQVVKVDRYLATFPKTKFDKFVGAKSKTSIDGYLDAHSDEKDALTKQLEALVGK